MRVLYCATDQRVPGHLGGSVHVQAVADGLAALGHEVHVATGVAGSPGSAAPAPGAIWHNVAAPLGSPRLRLLCAPAIARLARACRPDVILERYHNFGGEGVLAARRLGVPVVLEVNAPVIDHPGSAKARLDRALLLEPMRRWRDWQCRAAALHVTPLAGILPRWIPAQRVLAIEWGADTDLFAPDAADPSLLPREAGQVLVVFAGAFRPWHGAVHLVRALHQLAARGHREVRGVFIGDGPELARVRHEAGGLGGVTFLGAVPHDRMPAYLAAADIGVAPFDVGAHSQLQLGFYWSPLKVFEYMAAGLPVVAPDIDRLRTIVGHGRGGWLYDAADPQALAAAIERLLDPDLRRAMGARARATVVAEFSWSAHCARLGQALSDVVCRASQTPCES